jgi:hypothetical protein
MTYDEAKALVFCSGTVPDGYFGSRAHVGFAFDQYTGRTLVVHQHGYFTAPIPTAVDRDEARWLLNKHPTARNYSVHS